MNHQQMMQRILSIVKDAPDFAAGMASLFAYGRELQPTPRLWRKLERIDYASDTQLMLLLLRHGLKNPEIICEYTGIYFGLDGLNMPRGKGVRILRRGSAMPPRQVNESPPRQSRAARPAAMPRDFAAR
jgi:hypothetical protein